MKFLLLGSNALLLNIPKWRFQIWILSAIMSVFKKIEIVWFSDHQMQRIKDYIIIPCFWWKNWVIFSIWCQKCFTLFSFRAISARRALSRADQLLWKAKNRVSNKTTIHAANLFYSSSRTITQWRGIFFQSCFCYLI